MGSRDEFLYDDNSFSNLKFTYFVCLFLKMNQMLTTRESERREQQLLLIVFFSLCFLFHSFSFLLFLLLELLQELVADAHQLCVLFLLSGELLLVDVRLRFCFGELCLQEQNLFLVILFQLADI